MSEQTDTPTINTLGFSEWSAENDYADPLERRLKFGDYIREELIKADAYTSDAEIGIRQGLAETLREDGLLEADGSNAEELEQRMADIQRGKTFDQLARTFQQNLSERGEDKKALDDYFSAAVESPSPEYAEELQPLREKAGEVVDRNRDQLLRVKVDAGELPMARLSNGQLLVGDAAAKMDLVDALKASAEGGVTMGDALAAQAQLDTPDGFTIPLYRIQRLAQAQRLLEVERKQNKDFDIQLDGLSTEAAQSEYSTMDWLEKKADDVGRGISNFFGRIMGQGEAIDKAEARREAVDEARGSNIRQIASKYALKFDMRPDDMELAIEQMVLENAVNKQMFEFHDEDDPDVGKNLRLGGYGLPILSPQALVNKDVFDKTIAANPELSGEVKTMLNKQRVAHLRSEFTSLDKFLSDSNVSDEWNTALIAGRTAGVEDYKILEGFVADKDNYNEFAERAAGIGMSFVNGVGQLFAAVPAAFGFEPAKDYLASVSQKNADRRQLAAVFGEEFGLLQDAAETAFPMLIDVGATVLLAAATAPAGGAGGVAYASLKAGGTATASMTAKGMFKSITSNVFRKTGAKSTADQAEDLLEASLIKGTKEGAVDILNAYNSKLSAHLGNLPAIFLPAATRSGSATYGAVYNQLKQDPSVSEEDAHDRALGAMLMAGTFTGVLTASFSTIGRGGMEDALLKGLSYKQMKTVAQSVTGKLDGDLLSAAEIAIKKTMKKYAFGGAKGLAKNVFDEGIEESIDEFVNGLITDAALHEDTPMLERLQQTWHAFVLGGIMGGSVPLVQKGFRALQPDVLRQREMSSFYDDILEEMSTDLTESGAPITAEVVNAIVSDMRRKDARASVVPTAEEQAALIGRPEPEATEDETQLPSGITPDRELAALYEQDYLQTEERQREEDLTPDPEMEALLGEKVNPDSVAKATAEVLAENVPVTEGADPTTLEAKGSLMQQLELPLQESSSVENADHQAIRGLMQRRRAKADAPVSRPVAPKQTIIDPARAEEAEAIEAGFRQSVEQINKAEALYKKMDKQVAAAEVAGESPVRRALEQRVREGKAVSPEQATELRGDAFKDRVLALKELKVERKLDSPDRELAALYEQDYLQTEERQREEDFYDNFGPEDLETGATRQNNTVAIDNIIRSGFPQILTLDKFKRLGIPFNQDTRSAVFLREANHQIQRQISEAYPKIPVTRPEGGYALDSAYGQGKVFIDRFGRGQFNNDPLTMLSLLETGAPIVVDPAQLDSPTLNPAFRFTQVGETTVVSNIMVPESGGLVSALTPTDHALLLQPDYSRVVDLVERVNAIRSEGFWKPDVMIDSPFEPNTQMTAQEALTQLEEGVDRFIVPTTGELSPDFAETAQVELRLRAQEALFNGDSISLPAIGREVADTYMAEQKARLKHTRESFASTVSVNGSAELEAAPDFNAISESEDTYTPFPENAPPPFSESGIVNMLNEAQSDAVAAIDADPRLRQSVVNLLQNEVFESSTADFNRHTGKQLLNFVVHWMAQGNNRANRASLEFQKALRTNNFEMGAPLRQAFQLMGLSSASVEGTPKTDAAYRAFLRQKISILKGGAEPSDTEVFAFHNYVRRSVGALLLRSQPSGMSKAHDRMVNRQAIAALGLKDGDSESIIEALRRIVGVSDRAQKEYDSHLVSIAQLLLQSPDFIRSIELSIDETSLNYAGKFDTLSDGTPTISINITGSNPRGVADTLLHELIHAYVTGVTRKPADQQTRQESAAISLLEGVVNDLRADFKEISAQNITPAVFSQRAVPKMMGNNRAYEFHDSRVYDALANVDEFVAHFLTSTDFQALVKNMLEVRNAPAPWSRFEQIVAAIRSFFLGANPEFDAAFSAVLDLSHSSVLAAGPRRRSRRKLISVEEFLNLPNKESRTAKDFIADSVFPTDPATNNTTAKEPVTTDAIVGKIAEDVSRSQQEAVRFSSGVQAANGVEADQRGQEAVERIISFIRNRVVPPEMRVEVDINHPSLASVNSETGVMVVNPNKMAALLGDLQRRNGGRPPSMRNQMNMVAVVINEEVAHASSIATLTRAERDEIINGMTFADAEEAMSNYGDEGNVANRERLLEGWRNGDVDAQREIMEEYLRQYAQKVSNGFSTEEEVAFLRRNPNLVQTLIRYFQRFLKKLGYYKSRRNISPQLRTAVDRVVNEVRALEAGFRHTSNFRPFDANNPDSVIEQFRKQANMNKPIERPDEPMEAEPALASGIMVGQAQVPADAGEVIDARDWTKVGRQLGSNMGGVYEDGEGNKFYFKESKSPEHARNEVLATILYETAGANILPIRLATGKNAAGEDVLGTASEWREDFTDFDPQDPAMRKLAYDDFAVHAWLANWDVVGLVYDNLMVDGEGNVVHVDTGGALEFRAQGEPKGGAWNEEGSEFATLRVMGQAGEVFGGMSTTDLQNSANELRKMSDDVIRSAVERVMGAGADGTDMVNTLIARRDNILNVAFGEGQFVSSGITAGRDVQQQAGITAEVDAEYMAAVERGDTGTAQRMVDEATKAAGYPERGARAGVYRDGKPLLPSQRGLLGVGYYAVLDGTKEDVREFAGPIDANVRDDKSLESRVDNIALDLGSNPLFFDSTQGINIYIRENGLTDAYNAWAAYQETINAAYKKIGVDRPDSLEARRGSGFFRVSEEELAQLEKEMRDEGASEERIRERLEFEKGIKNYASTRPDASYLLESGFATAIIVDHSKSDGERDFKEVIVANPNQIKSAEPVTRDADGNVIPLSQRFDTTQESILRSGITVGDFDFDGDFPEGLEYDRFEDGRFRGAPLRKFQAGMLSEGEKPSEKPLTEKEVEELEERLKKLTVEGEVGRYWYEDAAKKILEITNGNVVEAEKLIALLAIYSPQTGVEVNTYFAIRGYEQHANNVSRKDYKVKTAVQDNKARAVLYDNKDWVGRKTDNFYKNIMFHIVQEATPEQLKAMRIDTAFLEDIQQPVTVDMWVYRALGYDTIGLTDKEGKGPFGFSEKMINRITYSLNQNLAEGEPRYEAHQVQAMIWTAIKARSEDKAVKKKTEAESIAAGDLVRRGPERIFTKRKVTKMVKGEKKEIMSDAPSERDHQRRWTENALAATGVDFVEAARSFDYFVNTMGMLATWEVIASTETEVGKRLAAMSFDEKRSFTTQAMELIVDPTTGEDLLAKELGIAISTAEISTGGYAGGVTPNVLSTLYPNKPAGTYDDDAIRAYARGLQYIFMQDAVPWARFIKKTKQDVHYRVVNKDTGAIRKFDTQEKAEEYAADIGKEKVVYKVKNQNGKVLRNFKTREEADTFAANKAEYSVERVATTKGEFVVEGNEQSEGVKLEFANDLNAQDLQDIQERLGKIHPDYGFTQVSANEIIVVNYKMDYNNMLPVLTDKEWNAKIIGEFGNETTQEYFTTVGEYGYHDWGSDPEGASILETSPRFTPDVQTWVRGRRQGFQQIAPQPEEGRLASGITLDDLTEDYGFASEAMRRVFEPRRDRLRIRTDVERDESPAIQLTGFPEGKTFLDVIKKAPQRQQEARKDVGNVPLRLRAIDREFFALEQGRKQAPTAEERIELSEKQRALMLEVATLKGYSPSLYHGTARKLSVQALLAKYGISHITADGEPVMRERGYARVIPDGLLENLSEFAEENSFAHRYPFEVYRGATGEHYTPKTGLMFFTPRDYSARSFAAMKKGHLESEALDRMTGKGVFLPHEEIVLPTFIKADKIFDPREDWEQVADILNRLKAEGRLGTLAYSPITPRGVSPADPVPFHLPSKAEIKRDDVAAQHAEDYYRMVNGKWDWWEKPEVIDAVFDMGYDAILLSEYASEGRVDPDDTFNIAVRDPSKVKTAHTRTYDKDGNLIPLSKRFDEGKDAHMYSGITTEFGHKETDSLTAEQAKELKEIQEEYDSILNEYRGILSSDPRIRNASTNAKESAQIKTILTQTEEVQKGYLYEFLGKEFEGFGFSPDLEAFGDAPDMSVPQMVADQITKRLQPLVDRAAELTGWSRRNMYHGTSVAKDRRPQFDMFDASRSDFAGKFGLTFFSPKVIKAEEFIQMQETGVYGHAVIPVVAKDEMSVFDPRVNWEEFIDDMGVAFAREYFGPNAEYATDAEVLRDYRDTKSSYGDVGEVFSESILDKIKRGYWLYWEKPELVDIIMSKYDGMLVTEVGGGNRMLPEYAGDDGLPKDEHMNLAIRNPNLVKSVAPITLDSKGEIVPLSDRFNPDSPKYIHSGITFGDASDLPSEFNSEGVDYSQFIEVLEMPFIEKGPFQKVKGTWRKLFKGETDPTVQRYVRQRDSFLRTSDKIVDEYHSKYKSALEKDFPNPDDIPWDDIQAATGTTDNIDPDPDNVLLDARNKVKDAAHAQYQADLAAEYAKHKQAEDAEIVNIDATEPDPDKRKPLYKAAADARRAKQEASKTALGITKEAAYEQAQKDYEADKAKAFDTKKADMIKDRNEAFDRLRSTAPSLFPVLLDLRRLTDELSAKAKKLFGVFSKKDLSVKFDNNMGLYVTRRYHMFSDTDYVERILTSEEVGDKAVRDAAIDFMRDQFITFEYDRHRRAGLSDADAQAAAEAEYDSREEGTQSLGYQMARDFLQSFDTESGAVDFASAFDLAGKPASLPSRMSDSLKALTKNLEGRAEIPKPLADLMGANNVPEDSIDSLLYTLGTVSKISAHQSFLNAMREQGEQGGWLMTSQQIKEARKKAKSKEEFDLLASMKPIVSSGADSGLNPLAGMYATPEVQESIRPMFQQTVREPNDASSRALHNAMTYAQKATGSAMAFKTLGSIGFYLRNMLSNVLFFGPAQGYWSAGKSLYSGNPTEGTGMSALMATRRAWTGNTAPTSAYLRELEALGVFGDEVRSEIMLKLMRGEETFSSLEAQLQSLNKKASNANPASKVWREAHNKAARLGSAMDSFYKIGYFEHELAVIEEAAKADPKGRYGQMSDMQRKQHAADIISATAQSYSRALPVIKKISGSGFGLLFAPFIRFTAEVPRIAVNTFTLARKEMKDSNPVIKARGRRRMTGFSAVAIFSTAVPAMLQKLLSDMGEDEDEAFRMSLPPYLRNHTFYYFKGDSAIAKAARKLAGGKEGDLTTFDLTYLNPFAVIADPFLRGMEHLVRGEPMVAAEKIVTTAFLEPYLGDQILAGSIIDVRENRNARSGRPIYEESDPLWLKASKMIGYVGKEAYGPRTPMKFYDAWRSAGGEVNKFADSPFGIIMSEFYPVRPRPNDPADQFSRVVYQLRDEQRRVQQRFNQLKQSKGMDERSVKAIHRDIRKSRMRINSKLAQAMSGFNGLGVSNYDLYQQLRRAKYGDRRTKLLFAGFMENPVPSTALVEALSKTTQGQQRLKWLMEEHSENPRFLKLDD